MTFEPTPQQAFHHHTNFVTMYKILPGHTYPVPVTRQSLNGPLVAVTCTDCHWVGWQHVDVVDGVDRA